MSGLKFTEEEIKHLEDLKTALNKRDIALAKRSKVDKEIEALEVTLQELLKVRI